MKGCYIFLLRDGLAKKGFHDCGHWCLPSVMNFIDWLAKQAQQVFIVDDFWLDCDWRNR